MKIKFLQNYSLMKNLKYLRIIILSIFISIVAGCEKIETSVVVQNDSDRDLYCALSTKFPDTTFTFISVEQMRNDANYLVRTNSSSSITNVSFCNKGVWDQYVNGDTLILFTFDKALVDNMSWATIKSRYWVYKRLYISYSQLNDNKCTIVVK